MISKKVVLHDSATAGLHYQSMDQKRHGKRIPSFKKAPVSASILQLTDKSIAKTNT